MVKITHYPYYREDDDRWKNSVRHNLSINPQFKKGEKATQGAGHFWKINEIAVKIQKPVETATPSTSAKVAELMEELALEEEGLESCLNISNADETYRYVHYPAGETYADVSTVNSYISVDQRNMNEAYVTLHQIVQQDQFVSFDHSLVHLDNLDQVSQNQYIQLENLGNVSQNQFIQLENLGEVVQNQFVQLGNLNQGTRNHFDQRDSLTTENQFVQRENLDQVTRNQFAQLENFDRLNENPFSQHENLRATQDQFAQLENLDPTLRNQFSQLENLDPASRNQFSQPENLDPTSQDQFAQLENLDPTSQNHFVQATKHQSHPLQNISNVGEISRANQFIPNFTPCSSNSQMPAYENLLVSLGDHFDIEDIELDQSSKDIQYTEFEKSLNKIEIQIPELSKFDDITDPNRLNDILSPLLRDIDLIRDTSQSALMDDILIQDIQNSICLGDELFQTDYSTSSYCKLAATT